MEETLAPVRRSERSRRQNSLLRDYGKYTWIFVWVLPVKFDSEVHGANLGNLGNEIEGTSNRGGEEPGLPGLVAGVPSDVSDSEESEGDSVADSEEENSSADADLPEPERRFITYRLQNNWEGEEGQDIQEEGGRAEVIEETAQEAGRNNLEEEDPDVRAEREFLEENDVEMRRNERENETLKFMTYRGMTEILKIGMWHSQIGREFKQGVINLTN